MARTFVNSPASGVKSLVNNIGSPVTVAGWFRETSLKVGQPSHTLWAANDGNPYNEMNSNNGILEWAYSGTGWVNTGITLPLNIFTHVAFVGFVGVATTFLNGIRRHSAAYAGGVPRRSPIIIGGYANFVVITEPVNTYSFAGDIADFAVWNIALTDNEIMLLAKGSRADTVRPNNLIGYWPLGYTSPEPDFSNNGNDGTVTNATYANDPSELHRLRYNSIFEMPVLFTPTVILYSHNIGASFTRKVTTIGY